MQLLVAADEPMTATQLANANDGLSHEAVRRAYDVLHREGRIRLTARTRGGGKLYAPMPEELAAS